MTHDEACAPSHVASVDARDPSYADELVTLSKGDARERAERLRFASAEGELAFERCDDA